ncbi:MAG: hypothetical protein Q9160_007099 [Pyrenula sp. 1 TL-2023]
MSQSILRDGDAEEESKENNVKPSARDPISRAVKRLEEQENPSLSVPSPSKTVISPRFSGKMFNPPPAPSQFHASSSRPRQAAPAEEADVHGMSGKKKNRNKLLSFLLCSRK